MNNIILHTDTPKTPLTTSLRPRLRYISDQTRTGTTRIALSTAEGLHILRCESISYCAAESNYCCLYMTDGRTLLVSKTLKSIASILPEADFFRVHQSYVVRMDQIAIIGSGHLTMSSGIQLPIARGRSGKIKEIIYRSVAHLD